MRVLLQVVGVFGRPWVWAALLIGAGACAEAASNDTAEVPSKPPKAAPTPAKPAGLQVNVFLEYSGGMKGFVPVGSANRPATEFQQRISSLLTETQVSRQVSGRTYQIIYQGKDVRSIPFDGMRRVVQGQEANAAKGTELPEMLTSVLSRATAANEVSVIISDFIYGPQNKAKIPFIADEIRTAVDPVRQQKLAVAVLAERSAFFGTYHPAVKVPEKQRQLRGEKIPYYIWVVGPPTQVSKYLGQVLKALPAEQALYGFALPAPKTALLGEATLPGLAQSGQATIYYDSDADDAVATHKLVVDGLDDGSVEFSIGLALTGLPPQWQQPAVLRRLLKLELPQGQAQLLAVNALSPDQRRQDPALGSYTHAARVRLARLPAAGTGRLSLYLPAPETPAWAAAWTTANDNLPTGRTFALDQILRGVRGAYPAPAPAVFTSSFTLRTE